MLLFHTEGDSDFNLIIVPFISEFQVWTAAGNKLRATTASSTQCHGSCWVPGLAQVGASRRAAEPRTQPMNLSSKFFFSQPHPDQVLNGKCSEFFSVLNEVVYVKRIVLNARQRRLLYPLIGFNRGCKLFPHLAVPKVQTTHSVPKNGLSRRL